MIKSKFERKESGFRAQKIFTDRKEPRHVLAESLQEIDRTPMQIVTYYGKGGIGKSRLLKEMYNTLRTKGVPVKDYTFIPVFISLDAYDYANPINILTTIRNCVKADCALFDYAMTLYCAKTKMSLEDIKDRQWKVSSNVLEHVNDVLALATLNAAIPLKWIKTAIDAIHDIRFQAHYKEAVLELSSLSEFEIFERLPHYLGLCLQQASLDHIVHVFFFDSYESLLARTYGHTPSAECDEWVRELFISSGQVRFVIATRDRLKWDEQDPDWAALLDQHRLNNLSDNDARWFLEQVPIGDENIVDFIVRNSKGVPLYLDMCVDTYETLYNLHRNGLTSAMYLEEGNFYSTRGKIIIDRYLRHLSPKQHNVVKVLCVLHTFDRAFALQLLQRMNLPCFHDELAELLDKSIFLPIDHDTDRWKMDESIRVHIWSCLSKEDKQELIGTVINITAEDQRGFSFVYFANMLEHILATPSLIAGNLETILQEVEFYANGGFWNELHGLLAGRVDHSDRRIQAISVIGEAICLRRFGHLEAAAGLLDTHSLDSQLLGRFRYYYAFLKAYISHLQGHYNEALDTYTALLDEMTLIKSTLPFHIYLQAALKQADLLYLKGRFDEANQRVDRILEAKLSPTDQVEALRIKGHICRFKQQFAKARLLYDAAYAMIRDSSLLAEQGKLYTNLIEANCFDQPQAALRYLEKTIDYNHDNDIELVKCYAAAAIAFGLQGDLKQADDYLRLSFEKVQLSGYQAGQVFAVAAKAMIAHVRHDPVVFSESLAELDELTQRLDVYQFVPDMIREQCAE